MEEKEEKKGEVGRCKRERNRGERVKTVGGREKYWTVLDKLV